MDTEKITMLTLLVLLLVLLSILIMFFGYIGYKSCSMDTALSEIEEDVCEDHRQYLNTCEDFFSDSECLRKIQYVRMKYGCE